MKTILSALFFIACLVGIYCESNAGLLQRLNDQTNKQSQGMCGD